MCGRFTLTTSHPRLPDTLQPQYNISPSTQIWCEDQDGVHQRRWGLIPHWVKDRKKIPFVINARWESAAEKPFFREALKSRRALIPADGFFEWNDAKEPFWIRLPGGIPFCFAGLWEAWIDPDDEGQRCVETCVILTTKASGPLASLHERMPICVKNEQASKWLDSPSMPEFEKNFELKPVSTFVNKATHQGPRCIEGKNVC
jgi:putative SOS response-associated peptidase YedK